MTLKYGESIAFNTKKSLRKTRLVIKESIKQPLIKLYLAYRE